MKRVYKSFLAAGKVSPDEHGSKQAVDRMSQHLFLTSLQDRNEVLFYNLICRYIEEMAPVIYTPTVGDACINAQYLYRRSRGMYFSSKDKGDIFGVLQVCTGTSTPSTPIVTRTHIQSCNHTITHTELAP